MKKLLIPFLLLLFTACQQTTSNNDATAPPPPPRDGVFIHISHGSEDAHRLLMALSMAHKMASDKDVLVYMDIEAVHAVKADAMPITMEGFEASNILIDTLLKQNVGIYACPACMKVAGITPEQLIPGVQTAQKEAFFNFTRGRIISLDY